MSVLCEHPDPEETGLGGGISHLWCHHCGAVTQIGDGMAYAGDPWRHPGKTVGIPVVWPIEYRHIWEWREALSAIADEWEKKSKPMIHMSYIKEIREFLKEVDDYESNTTDGSATVGSSSFG